MDDDKNNITQDNIDEALADNAARSEEADEKVESANQPSNQPSPSDQNGSQYTTSIPSSSDNSNAADDSDSAEAKESSETTDSAVENETITEEKQEEAEQNPEEEISVEETPITDEENNEKSNSETSEPAKEPKSASATGGSKAHWYVVHTYSGHEQKVAATLKQRIDSQKLKDKILDILVPTQEKIEIKEGKKTTVKEKIFPGYLLIRMVLDDITWLAVRTTPGITSFVGNAQKPTPISEKEVETIRRFMSMEAPKFKTTFSKGEAIKIIEGPFTEFLGTISDIDEEKGKLKVMVSIFGRETPVELDFLQVNKL